MLNKANKLMEQRSAMINEAKEVLAVLQATESEMSYSAPATNITINKGKIVEVPVTKEIVIDKTNNEEIEQLKDELFAKELLLNDFRETADKNIKDMQKMNDEIKVYKGMVAGYEAQLQNKDLTIESLEKQIADMKENQLRNEIKSTNNNSVKKLQAELNKLKADYSALQNSYGELDEAYEVLADNMADRNRRIEDLKEEILDLKDEVENKQHIINLLNDNLKAEEAMRQMYETKAERVVYVEEEKVEEEQIVKCNEEQVIVTNNDEFHLITIPEKYAANKEIQDNYKYFIDKLNSVKEITIGKKTISVADQRKQIITKANEILTKLMDEMKDADQYNLECNTTKAKNGITSLYGKITLAGKEYAYKYDATFDRPCVFGCMDMNLIDEAKSVLDKLGLLDRKETEVGSKHSHSVNYDFHRNMVVWITDDGCFKGYTDKYAFVWDPAQPQPCGITVINALNNFKRYRKMNSSWGNGVARLADEIMNYCRQMAKQRTNVNVSETKEAPQTTKEAPKHTEEIITESNGQCIIETTTEWDDVDL